ncbi:MAG: hypothetical protein KDA80_11655 [Planctomycetaceae bacterium]|nr:hypothetical protein [Planctomycetaceae bacterium]
MAKWEIEYKGHKIEVRTRPNSRLTVDGEVQDETFGFGTRSRLWGRIKSGDGEGEQIRASVGGEWFSYSCAVFIDDTQVFRT